MIMCIFVVIVSLLIKIDVFAQDLNCMWGQNDILCQSSKQQRELQRGSQGNRSGGLNDERIYNPDAGSFAEDMVKRYRQEFEKGFDDRFTNPYSLHYDATKDRCMIDPNCNMMAKGRAHYNWLAHKCIVGNDIACQKLQAGAYTRPPSGQSPNGGQMNVPYYPGTEPAR